VTQRAVPFYCPYCGDEDLQPYADRHGSWWCQSCRRAWSLSMIGTGTPSRMGGQAGEEAQSAPNDVESGQ
jgi:transposase-like protein